VTEIFSPLSKTTKSGNVVLLRDETSSLVEEPTHSSAIRTIPTQKKDGIFIASAVRSMLQQSVEEPDDFSEKGWDVFLDYEWIDYWVFSAIVGLRSWFTSVLSAKMRKLSAEMKTDLSIDLPLTELFGLDSWDSAYSALGSQAAKRNRVKKTKNGFVLSYYLGADPFFNPEQFWRILYNNADSLRELFYTEDGRYDYQAVNKFKEKIDKVVAATYRDLFGEDFFDLTKAVDITIDDTGPFDFLNKEEFVESEETYVEALDAIEKTFGGFRLISPPLPGGTAKTWNSYYDNTEGNEGYKFRLEDIGEDPDKRDLYSKHVLSRREIVGFINLTIPKELAEYFTQLEFSNIKPGHIGLWSAQWTAETVHPQASGNFSYMVNPVTNIAEANKPYLDKIQPRTNNGLAIDLDGHLVYIPEVDNSQQYEDKFNSAGVSEADGEFTFDDTKTISPNQALLDRTRTQEEVKELSEKHKFPSNQIIYTDWVNNKLAYTSTGGLLSILDIEGFAPATPTHLRTLMDQRLFDDTPKMRNVLSAITSVVSRSGSEYIRKSIDSYEEWWPLVAHPQRKDNPGYRVDMILRSLEGGNITNAATYLVVTFGDMIRQYEAAKQRSEEWEVSQEVQDVWEEYSSRDAWTVAVLSSSSPIIPLRYFGQAIQESWNTIYDNVPTEDLFQNRSPATGIYMLGTLSGLAQSLGRYDEIVRLDNESRRVYMEAKRDSNHIPEAVPLVKDRAFLPHQAANDAILTQNPKNAILAVDAGGGKTIQILTSMLRDMGKGNVKSPLILCPGHLVKNYVEEVAYLTEGKLNVIALNTDIINTYGEDNLRKIMRSAPPNTVVVADYDFIKGRKTTVPYGTTEIDISGNAEFLREFDFDSTYLDESHYLKNPASQRSRAAQRVVSSIPKRLLATGTFTPNQITDVIGQMNMLDPSIFGDTTEFLDKYAEDRVGNTILWRVGAEKEVAQRIGQYAALITTKRKEWQYLLPRKEETFHYVELNSRQRAVYDSILQETIEQIKANEELRKKLEEADEDESLNVEMLLRPYLQRLEMFLSAPGTDPLGAELLSPEDQVSPKALKILSLIKEHEASGDTGKALIFTSYVRSAEAIYAAMPAEMRSKTLLYKAENKAEDLARFNRDDKIKYLVGVEQSLNTGLNLQRASRLIRVETVWNPGTLEQAESRVNRPDPKNKNQRTKIYLDWLVCNNTIDVTKIARLISKMIKVTKFEEQNNPLYDDVPDDVNLISMTLNNILTLNTWGDLEEYLLGYQSLKRAEKKDYEEYRARPDVKTDPVPISEGFAISNSKLLSVQPYVEDMVLPFMDELGIERFSDYANEHGNEGEYGYRTFDAVGLRVHTERGDGKVVSSRKNSLRVKLDSGITITTHKLKTFVITKDKDAPVRDRLQKLTGLTGTATKVKKRGKTTQQEKIEDKTSKGEKVRKPVPNVDFVENREISLFLSLVNNSLAIGIDDDDPDVSDRELKKMGFRFSGPYVYYYIPTALAMRKFIAKLTSSYNIPKAYLESLTKVSEAFTSGRKKLLNAEAASQIELKNFWRTLKRKTPTGTLKPYPVVQDGYLYICFSKRGQPSVNTLGRTLKGIPGVTRDISNGEYMAFFKRKTAARDFIKGFIDAGNKVSNLKQVRQEYKEIKIFGKKKAS